MSIEPRYIIVDWAGNRPFRNKDFGCFDEAWDFILDQFPDEEDLSDFEVVDYEEWKRFQL